MDNRWMEDTYMDGWIIDGCWKIDMYGGYIDGWMAVLMDGGMDDGWMEDT